MKDERTESEAMWECIKILEVRIKALELELHLRTRQPRDDEAGEEYWEHG